MPWYLWMTLGVLASLIPSVVVVVALARRVPWAPVLGPHLKAKPVKIKKRKATKKRKARK